MQQKQDILYILTIKKVIEKGIAQLTTYLLFQISTSNCPYVTPKCHLDVTSNVLMK